MNPISQHLEQAINHERKRLFRAEALAQALSRLLHERDGAEDEIELGYLADALRELVTEAITRLDSTNLKAFCAEATQNSVTYK